MSDFMTPICENCGPVDFRQILNDQHVPCGGLITWKEDELVDTVSPAIKKTGLEDYVITQDPDDEGIFSVWHEKLTEPYEVVRTAAGNYICTCPHYQIRLRKTKSECKHIQEVKIRLEKGKGIL